MQYNVLLYIMKKRKDFYRFREYIKPHTVPPDMRLLLDNMDQYFKINEKLEEIDFSVFVTWFKLHKIPSMSKEKHSIYDKIFDTLLTSPPSDAAIKSTIEMFVEKDFAVKMSDHLIKITEGDDSKSILEVERMVDEYKKVSDRAANAEALFSKFDVDEVLSNHLRPGLNWRMPELNTALGPLRQGDFMIVTSRPDSGKTTFLCSEATYMAAQLEEDKDVVWFNNEETAMKVQQRIYQAALGWTKEHMAKNKLATKKELERLLGRLNKIKIVDHKLMTTVQVEEALDNCNPGLIVFDQLWKVAGFKDAYSEVDKTVKLFGWARDLADRYGPVINVHQADGSAEGQEYIQMNQLYNSKTGIQGEADVILGIGRTHDPMHLEDRFFYVSKNKLDGGASTDPTKRNNMWICTILPDIARFQSAPTLP